MRRIIFSSFLVASAALLHAQIPPRSAAVDEAVRKYMEEKKVTAASVAIAHEGRIVFQKGYGAADLENDVPAKPETVYRLASVSKTMTAIAVMQQVEAGKLDLDADVRKNAPEFPDKGAVVTLRHLLSHTSGVRHYKANEDENYVTLRSVVEGMKRFQDDPLVHKPGEKFTYSTYAFSLLARAVETVSGLTFGEYLRQRVFEPSAASATGLEDLAGIVKNRTRGYRRLANGTLVNSEFADISYKWAGGGMVSTAPDLCRIGMALLADRLMKPETRALMWTRQKLNSGESISQTLGWGSGTFRERPVYMHTGAQQATRTFLAIVPRDNLIVAVLTNYESHSPADLGNAVRDAWYGPASK